MARIVAIAGSPSAPSRSASLLAEVADRIREHGHSVDTIDVRRLPAQALLSADTADHAVADALRLVQHAHGIIVATPIYKASYSGALKTFLDVLPQRAFTGKVVLPLATAGSPAHVLVVDYALRPVLSSLGARHITPGWVSVSTGAGAEQAAEHLLDAGSLHRAVTVFLDSLPGTPGERAIA